MNATRLRLSATAGFLPLALVFASLGQAQGPTVGVEPIVVTLSATPPGNVFEQFYPNLFDPTHPKKLTFQGTFTNADPQRPAFVDLWFDWIDPADPPGTGPRTSGVVPIDLGPGASKTYGGTSGVPPIMHLIPFCPPQVSIHIQNNGPGQPVVVDGTFIHECLIPEPGSAALAGIGLAAFCGALKRRR